ncbi:transcription antitermination factor NusB [Rickettsia felis str. Pedreira]|uniref:Transcription antitermination protein NusB n=2 Tax=Rickettsia felis TaxID=42862 RepID=NUSB_RICFE|nr:transcription antitermination factor NusB [Rickettsia felis]Q4UKG1.1 RecName: Full=Transcription antitermination protein NusB; AltName: Full=Antitermination factor NusB [Rickettsia felis URRWXCal2]AAY61970.1 N utilization substance protein B [Rickettsia felis URRWXCal2]KHO02451.1 antitermination protein NusB [Rickettsia felis str. LSU]KHO03094.1 antitermination protein NusB [Rickettsia felis]KJV58888.1 transcription antitermination factor NusB [Rickettsia felis str. Pedreira]MDE8611032.1 t
MSSNKINKKSIARIAAVQAIYQNILQNNDDMDDIMQNVLSFYQNNNSTTALPENLKISLSISHFKMLVKSVFENINKLDEIIDNHLTNDKDPAHMPILLRALLRVSICELLFCPTTPAKVVINEYTDIANDMLNEHEIGFVNSILDKIAQENNKIS